MKIRLVQTLVFGIFLTLTACKTDAKNISTPLDDNEVKISASSEMESEKSNTATTTNKVNVVKNAPKPVFEKASKAKTADNKATKKEKPKAKSSTVKTVKEINTPKERKEETAPKTNVTPVVEESKPEVIKEKPVSKPEKTAHTINTEKPEKSIQYETPVGQPNHKLFDSFLKKYVSSTGVVDYTGMSKSIGDLDQYLTSLETSTISSSWSRDQKLVYWMNAYNAYTIKLILDNFPVKSITDINGGKPWDKKWIKLNGKTLSLNNIENDIIRPEFKEPRIHFAVNCAAVSCPPIMNAAFTVDNMETQLERQTKKFINNTKYNTLGASEVTISKIFDWYGVDFGNVSAFVGKYASTPVNSNANVKFNEYNWSLNGK